MTQQRFHPIVYIRGYAGTQSAVEATVATPYMGFNLGSTKIRQSSDPKPYQYVFESPVLRLGKDHEYRDVYERGEVITKGEEITPRSIWIFRYYDQVSQEMSPDPKRVEIEDYAEQLADFLENIRDLVCEASNGDGSEDIDKCYENFRVYLVAHSMGGLIARAYLQNVAPARTDPVQVDKVFTYATPHRGIDMKLVGNLLTYFPLNNAENFNRTEMRKYLKLSEGAEVNSLDGKFPPEKFFCLVGSNHRDYGLPRHAIGAMSDGLVRITNAYVQGAPRAFVHRSHSGDYGIVNSEEGYQNLRRFLFGDDRVDVMLEIDEVTLPPDIWEEWDKSGGKIEASYHFEVITKVRGTRWDLHRRTVAEESAMFVDYKRIKEARPLTLATGFLLYDARVNKRDKSMGFSLDLGLRVPEYKVDGLLWMDNYYEGGYIFRDKFNFDLIRGSTPNLRYGLDSRTTNRTSIRLDAVATDQGGWEFRIPVGNSSDPHPRLRGELLIRSAPWNR